MSHKNPFNGPAPKPTRLPFPDPPECITCRDFGYIMPAEWDQKYPPPVWIPAGVLYQYGIPCTCAEGQQFARDQHNWNLPIPNRPTPRYDPRDKETPANLERSRGLMQ
jgi:hypothetical protein